jgi:hypothetical protein
MKSKESKPEKNSEKKPTKQAVKERELSEQELNRVAGGLDGLKGDSTDSGHKDWIETTGFRTGS